MWYLKGVKLNLLNTAETLIQYMLLIGMNKTRQTLLSYLTTSSAYTSALLFWEAACFSSLNFLAVPVNRVYLNVISLKQFLCFQLNLYRSDQCDRQQGAKCLPSASCLYHTTITRPCTSFIGDTPRSRTFAASPQRVHWNLPRSLLLREMRPQCCCGRIFHRCGVGSLSCMWHVGSTKKKISKD